MLGYIFTAKAAIYAVMMVSIIAAVGAVMMKNLFHAALCFITVLVGIAIIFISMGAEFIGLVQILIYVGAVMTLVIFAIMLTSRMPDENVTSHNRLGLPALLGAIALFYIFTELIFQTPWPVQSSNLETSVSAASLGKTLMTEFVFPFEIVGILLTAVLIGSLVIMRKEKRS